MTEQIKSAIEDLSEFSNNGCDNEYLEDTICGMCKNPCEKGMSIITAIRSLQAWEEVLQELEAENNFWTKQAFKHKDDEFAEGKTFGLSKAIDIINQKLKGVTEWK